jgi:hypothetical protein
MALAALLLFLLSATPAAAADQRALYNRVASASDPAAAYAALGPRQKAAVAAYLTPVRTTITPIEPASTALLQQAVGGCKEVGHSVGKYNGIGVLLWTWNLYAEVCYDGSRITYNSTRHYGITYVWFWSWRTVGTNKVINTTLNPDRLTYWGQGEFKLCLFGDIGCAIHNSPWNELRFNANGGYSWRWFGG